MQPNYIFSKKSWCRCFLDPVSVEHNWKVELYSIWKKKNTGVDAVKMTKVSATVK